MLVQESLTILFQCQGFGSQCFNHNATRYRMNTAYHDEEDNWTILCPDCQEDCSEHWKNMWAEYYSMVM